MTESSPPPGIRASLNEAGELVLTAVNAPPEAVIRIDVNADSPRMLCTQGRYLAPVQAPPGARIRFRLFRGKRGITAPETFIMPGPPPARAVPSTLIPCTQDRDFMIYDWASRHEAACRIVRETHPDLLFIGDSITHFWGGAPVDEPHRDILQKSPETWNLCTAGMRAVNLGFGYDRVENALWRLRHGELDGAEDNAVCVVLLGTNNLAENTDGEILEGIRAVCREITGKLAKAVIILQGFYPRNSAQEGTAERIVGINLLLNRLATEENFIYTEPGRVMANSDGYVPEELSSDGLHPSAAGYARIAAVLAPVIRQAAERENDTGKKPDPSSGVFLHRTLSGTTTMNEQDDTKLWQILGHASQPAPGDDFARKVMMRIEREECAPAVPVESIHHFKRHSFRIWGAAAAALVAAVIGIAALMEPSAPETAPLSIATLNIDDVLVEEAGLALGQENLVDALCVLSSTETGVISSDNIQDLLL